MEENLAPVCCWIGSRNSTPCDRPAKWIITPLPRPGVSSYDTYTESCDEHLPLLSNPGDNVTPVSDQGTM